MIQSIDTLEALHEKMLEAMRKQRRQAASLELAIIRSNGQIPKAFQRKGGRDDKMAD